MSAQGTNDQPDRNPNGSEVGRIPTLEALRILARARPPESIVVTNQTSARLWPTFSDTALDFHYNPSTMGGAVPFGLGLALSQPHREVVVVSGDGSLLMSLGSLVSVVDSGVTNLTIVLLENGVYEVTGCQRTPADNQKVEFTGIARSCGFENCFRVASTEQWLQVAAILFRQPGPRFVTLSVRTVDQMPQAPVVASISEQCRRLQERCRRTVGS